MKQGRPFSFVSNFVHSNHRTGTLYDRSDIAFANYRLVDTFLDDMVGYWSTVAYLVVILFPEVNAQKHRYKVNRTTLLNPRH